MNKTAEEIYPYLENEESSIGIREHNQRMYDCRQAYNKGFAAAQFAAPPPASEGEMAGFTKPFRVGRKQKRAILDAEGQFVGVFNPGNENMAKMFCDWLNGATLPTKEPEATIIENGYLCSVDGEQIMIISENISDCLDKLKIIAREMKAELVKHSSIPVYNIHLTPLPCPPNQSPIK